MLMYSVVLPVYNESGNLKELDAEIKQVMKGLKGGFEVIYVNDGSSDDSLKVLKSLKGVKIIDLNRNYGQSTALDAGFKQAEGKYVISLDSDLQNDPSDIPKLLKKLKGEGLDVVAGWRKERRDSLWVKLLSGFASFLRGLFINDPVHDEGCTLRVYRREAVQCLDLQGEMHRYIISLLRWKGFSVGEVVVNHRRRKSGCSKYGLLKCLKGFVDLLYVWFVSKYYQRPLHLFGYFSFFSLFLGLFSGVFTLYKKLVEGLSFNRNAWFFVSIFSLLASVLFLSFGITIQLLIRVYLNTSEYEDRYIINQVIET